MCLSDPHPVLWLQERFWSVIRSMASCHSHEGDWCESQAPTGGRGMASVQGREKNPGLALSASLHTDSLAVRGEALIIWLSLSLSLCQTWKAEPAFPYTQTIQAYDSSVWIDLWKKKKNPQIFIHFICNIYSSMRFRETLDLQTDDGSPCSPCSAWAPYSNVLGLIKVWSSSMLWCAVCNGEQNWLRSQWSRTPNEEEVPVFHIFYWTSKPCLAIMCSLPRVMRTFTAFGRCSYPE